MKLATFSRNGAAPVIGAVDQQRSRILDLQACHRARTGSNHSDLVSMLALIDSGQRGLDLVLELMARFDSEDPPVTSSLSEVRLLAPVPEPRQIRDFSTFERHLRDAPAALARMNARLAGVTPATASGPNAIPSVYLEQPIFYFSNRLNVIGTDTDVPWPRDSRFLDFELELAICIGSPAKNVTPERAKQHIFGYTIFNDVSARDVQSVQMPGGLGPCKGKSYDGCNVIGPWLVTMDEIKNPYNLRATVRVNGEEWITTKTDGVVHRFEDMIAFASRDETVHAGEIFGTGTVGGCCGLELDRWIREGDLVELEVEGIGVLRNRYVQVS